MSNNFEYVFNNTYKSITKKKVSRKRSLSKKNDRLFNNTNNNFKNLYNFYSKYDYENIVKIYEKMNHIIIDSTGNEQKKWNYTGGLLLYNVNYFLIYRLYKIILQGDIGIYDFINKVNKTIKFIKTDTDIPIYIQDKIDPVIQFKNNNIVGDNIIFDKYKLYPLTNNIYLSSFVIKSIDILNRYFKHISTEYDVLNFGFYVPNEDKTGDYVKSKNETEILIKLDIDNMVKTINNYREEKTINNFEIKYQMENENENDKKNLKDSKNFRIMFNKLNFIITYGYYFTYDTKKILKYIDEKLLEGGNLIFTANMDTPIKSSITKELLIRFKKSIITKATLEDPFNWVFIGKGYISSFKKNSNQENIDNFIDYTFIKSCINFNNFFNNLDKISKLEGSTLINEINKKYVEIYKWCINNNIEAINLFSDSNKEPKLIDSKDIVNKFFPHQIGVDKNQLKVFDISIYSITLPHEANRISLTIKDLFKIKFKYYNNIVITDGTSNVGGNTLSFSTYFSKVNSIEYNHDTFEGLKHNCENVYNRKNIKFYEGDCTKIIPMLKQDVIFIDPPWNGLFYKAYDKLHLELSNNDVFDILSNWFENKKAKIYCLKCPSNFDFDPFINKFENIYIQKQKKWNVIYILDIK